MEPPREIAGLRNVPCRQRSGGADVAGDDRVVVEEPLELRVQGTAIATIMRTPGDDVHLSLGFFFGEGRISSAADVGALAVCGRPGGEVEENVIDLLPAAGASIQAMSPPPRALPAFSSCGICGKRTIDEALAARPPPGQPPRSATGGEATDDDAKFRAGVLLGLPDRLRERQEIFSATGALHAAGLFSAEGDLLHVAEDIGRHNAVDKVVGWALLAGRIPLGGMGLQVSGRVSFEIVQKALRAGAPLVSAVSGVSSLGVDLAERAGITLIGFVRGDSMNVYTHPRRVRAG
jgi:FdhD protein